MDNAIATRERPGTDACDAIGNRDACKVNANRERRIADAYNAIGNHDVCKVFATRERNTTDARDSISINCFGNGNLGSGARFNACDGTGFIVGIDCIGKHQI